ncbi:hypothetical protein EJV47_08480 [Hymenobacter gummosus]|uniref:Uncharacterized protein n=1 Tax=Hymenobacter gummosus TaxID=1776032 RepID=A0A431U410_9BACT|nr:hypothetical protein [Hymenobacter gummosus]RTQ50660.1 hypothetical protein EJV47_08480 [Hymenobacter gummosus]
MRTYYLISLLLTSPLLTHTAPGQSLRRAWRDPVDSVTVMPPYALDSTVMGLLVYNDYPHTPGKTAKPGYVFDWPYHSVDGSLNMYISRRQLYLRTGHNNPNPNMLHWMQDITPAQFQAIDAVLKKPQPPFQAVRNSADFGYFRYLEFEPKTPSNPTLETEEQWKAFSTQEEQDLAGRVIRLLQQLNRQLPAAAQLRVPTEKELFARATHIAGSVDELLSGGGIVMSLGKRMRRSSATLPCRATRPSGWARSCTASTGTTPTRATPSKRPRAASPCSGSAKPVLAPSCRRSSRCSASASTS